MRTTTGILPHLAAVAACLAAAACGTGNDPDDAPAPRPGISTTSGTASPDTTRPDTATTPAPGTPTVRLPPANADVDYQIGGAYPPPPGTRVILRDRAEQPAPGLYNICYVNAYQSQPGEQDTWDPDLLLRNTDGRLVIDEDWNEPLLDISTPGKRTRIAARVTPWIDACAASGFDAVEPDNLDSYTRSDGLLDAESAREFARLLSTHAHSRGLAIAQKNTAELASARDRTGFDFAVAEECGRYDECGTYADAFGGRVIVIEYTDADLAKACTRWGSSLSIVRRDRDVSPAGAPAYERATCATR